MNGIQMFPAIARRLATVVMFFMFVGCVDESVDTPPTSPAPTADAGSSEPTTPSTTDTGDDTATDDGILSHEECMENAACGDNACAPAELYAELVAEIKAISEAPSVQQDETEDGTVFCTDPCEGLRHINGTWTCDGSAIRGQRFEMFAHLGMCYIDQGTFGGVAPEYYEYVEETDELRLDDGFGGYFYCHRST